MINAPRSNEKKDHRDRDGLKPPIRVSGHDSIRVFAIYIRRLLPKLPMPKISDGQNGKAGGLRPE